MADLLTSLSEFTMVKLTKTWEEQAFPHVWKKSQFYHCLHGQVKIRGQSCLDFSAAADTAVTMDWGAHSLWFASGGKLTQRGEDVFRQLSHTSQGKGEMMEEYNDVFWSTVNGREKDRKGLERAHKDDWEANRPLMAFKEGMKPPSASGCSAVSSLSHCHILGYTSHYSYNQAARRRGVLGCSKWTQALFAVLWAENFHRLPTCIASCGLEGTNLSAHHLFLGF